MLHFKDIALKLIISDWLEKLKHYPIEAYIVFMILPLFISLGYIFMFYIQYFVILTESGQKKWVQIWVQFCTNAKGIIWMVNAIKI